MLMDEILKLSVSARIELIDQIWDSLAVQTEEMELSEHQKVELERRWAAYQRDPAAGDSWENVKRRLLNRK